MNDAVGLNGQWVGRFGGTTSGRILFNVDALESSYRGSTFLFNDDPTLPGTFASFSIPEKKSGFAIRITPLLALDPKTMEPVPLDQLQGRFGSFSKYADVSGVFDQGIVQLTWKTDIGVEGNCALNRSRAGEPSELRAEEMNWGDYKQFVAGMQSQGLIFRGQNEPRRLRTSYHRLGRADMNRFVNEDMPMLYRKLSARTRHVFNIKDPDENGSFLNLVQHHGYPTPLLDWTYSPYVAAFFAYRHIANRIAEYADKKNSKVRVFIFDAEQWNKTFEKCMLLHFPKLHITIAEFSAIENERLIPQQAVTMVTNIDDIETYIRLREAESHKTFLRAVDLLLSERRSVVRELNYMGITPGSMFPGLDGACEDLKERNFDF